MSTTIVRGTDLEVDGCGVSLWETEAVLGAVNREVFFVLDEDLQPIERGKSRAKNGAHVSGTTRIREKSSKSSSPGATHSFNGLLSPPGKSG